MSTKPPRKASASRLKTAYAGFPMEYAELLDRLTEDGAKHQGWSRAFLVKTVLKKFLQEEGLLDAKGKPVPKAE